MRFVINTICRIQRQRSLLRKCGASDEPIEQPFDYPVALKPSNSVEWVDIHFDGRKKAYRVKSRPELDEIFAKGIYQWL